MIRRPPRSTLFPSPTLSRSPPADPPPLPPPAPPEEPLPPPPPGDSVTRVTAGKATLVPRQPRPGSRFVRSEEHTSELQSRQYLVCRLLLEKKKTTNKTSQHQ